MTVQLNHLIVPATDKRVSARFLAGILGLPESPPWGPFAPVEVANGVELDFRDQSDFKRGHYAFLVSEAEFDTIFGRIREAGVGFYADPGRTETGEINRNDGGRGVYFDDPDGHLMEIITRPYGGVARGG